MGMAQDHTHREPGKLGGVDFFLLWAGAAICLTEIWAGGLLRPLGLIPGILAIVLGHMIGCTPMALGGLIGSRHRVPSMVSTRGALGNKGSHLPAVLNIIQLIGWTSVMLWIGGQTAARLAPESASPFGAAGWIVVTGILTTLWSLLNARYWRWIQRIGVALLLALSVLMTVVVFRRHSFAALAALEPEGALPFMIALDLVIAMPISWMPLAADYARHARTSRGSFAGTWSGFLVGSAWMYVVGLAAAIATGTDKPDEMVMSLMGALNLAVPALMIVMLSTVTTTFLDIYSNAVSVMSIAPKLKERWLIVATGILGTALAAFFPAAKYESFLLFIGAMFCPLFGVVLTDYFLLKRGHYVASDLLERGRYWYRNGINPRALAAWAAGFCVYQVLAHSQASIGSSLPSLVLSGGVYYALMVSRKGAKNMESSSWSEPLASQAQD
jgi:NCS1 family nucleobase:cation symporter-1